MEKEVKAEIKDAKVAQETKEETLTPLQELSRADIREAKRKILKSEGNNHEYLFFWNSGRNWWKACENSAVMYVYLIQEKIGKQQQINFDTDRYAHATIGTISTPKMAELEEKFATIGIKMDKRRSTDMIKVFKLPPELVPEMKSVEHWRTEELGRAAKVNDVLGVKIVYPHVSAETRKLLEVSYNLFHKLSADKQKFIGQKIADEVMAVFKLNFDINTAAISPKTGLKKMEELITSIAASTALMNDLNMLQADKITRFAMHVSTLHTAIKNELKKTLESESKQLELNI